MVGQSHKTSFVAASPAENDWQPISLAKCRALLGAEAPESDSALEQLREQLYTLARVVVEGFPSKAGSNGSPHTPNGLPRAVDNKGQGQPAQAFPQVLASLPADDRYEIEERAAIHEFEGGLDRNTAEQLALSEHWRTKRGVK